MQTRNYTTELLPLIKALCGVEFAQTELGRIRSMVNSRATRAFRASKYWPRFLVVGEERTVTSGVIPWTQSGLSNIDTYLMIHRTEPYALASAQDFDFYVTNDGATIIDGGLNSSSAWVTYKKQHTTVYGDGNSGTSTAVPDEWFEYIAHGVYADWQRAEQQMEKAALADAEAMDKLTDELIRVDEMGIPANITTRINTNASMQTRWSY